jgi:type I restriction enzyme S subunit
MSYLEKLMEGVEMEWKTLGEVGDLVRGNGLPKSDFTEKGVPAIHYGQIYTHYKTYTIEKKIFCFY